MLAKHDAAVGGPASAVETPASSVAVGGKEPDVLDAEGCALAPGAADDA